MEVGAFWGDASYSHDDPSGLGDGRQPRALPRADAPAPSGAQCL